MTKRILQLLTVLSLVAATASPGQADSVAQIATAVRISRGTATLIDPQGRPGMMGMGTDTVVRVGDVLTFSARFTPVPNGGVRGLGGYVTVYIPRNTEVVGARLIDASGTTVAPHRGGWGADGTGPRGSVMVGSRLGGSMSQLHADTGVFYATDALTARVPDGSMASERFLSLFNGIIMSPVPTATGQLAPILGADRDNPRAHNQWDVIQAYGFGVAGAALGTNGRGNTPDRYGSPVAGPLSFTNLEASYSGSLTMPLVLSNVTGTDNVGPWNRIQSFGAEIGERGVVPPVPDPGLTTRVGVPATDMMGNPLGRVLNGDNALPAFDSASPSSPHTRALRFAVGELVVGEEYRCEFSLRVLATPLDPVSGSDVVCAEVFGGDASAENPDGRRDGKDNAWRYFLPAPACVSLNLLFDIDVDHLVVLPGGRLVYTITVKNLSTSAHNDVLIQHCYEDGEVTFVSATGGGSDGAGASCPDPANQNAVEWTIPRLEPGVEQTFLVEMDAPGGGRGDSTIGTAVFTSRELPAPGFQTVAFTVIQELAIIELDMSATPDSVVTPPGTVSYAATVSNTGTGDAGAGGTLTVTLPTGFTYVGGSASGAGAPTVAGNVLTFDGGLPGIAAGGSVVVGFDATVPAAHPMGIYTSSLETLLRDSGAGEEVNDARAGLAPVAVGAVRSDTPIVTAPILSGATSVSGTTTEAAGATIRVQLNGVVTATSTSDAAGRWTASIPTAYPGLGVRATAQAIGELESLPSAEVRVSSPAAGIVACNDGIDNDGDMLTDFPEDPGCASPLDVDEATLPACADGEDNDGDMLIDFGSDPGCASLLDESEDGDAECANGMDDDGDGLMDFPEDPGCSSATDPSESDLPECADGLDNDADGDIDYPLDTACTSALDPSETDEAVPDAGMVGLDAGDAPTSDGGVASGDGSIGDFDAGALPDDPGGVDAPSGCGCHAAGSRSPVWVWGIGLLGLVVVRRRRRRATR